MKLKYNFEIVEIGDEITAVPIGDGTENMHAVIQLNGVAADIMRLLAEDTTEDAVVDGMFQLYEANKEDIARQVHEFIEKFKCDGLIVE